MLYCGTGWRRYSSAFNSAVITMTKIGSFAYLLVLSLDCFTLAGFAKTAEVGSAVSLEYEVQQSRETGGTGTGSPCHVAIHEDRENWGNPVPQEMRFVPQPGLPDLRAVRSCSEPDMYLWIILETSVWYGMPSSIALDWIATRSLFDMRIFILLSFLKVRLAAASSSFLRDLVSVDSYSPDSTASSSVFSSCDSFPLFIFHLRGISWWIFCWG